MSNPKKAFFPGSFDPFTKGHEDIVLRALALFDEVIIGIGQNSNKSRYFPLEKMKEYIHTEAQTEENLHKLQDLIQE